MSWKRILISTTIYLMTEILFNLAGLDTIADYSEFIFAHKENRNCQVIRQV
jgi:hypothetical protein